MEGIELIAKDIENARHIAIASCVQVRPAYIEKTQVRASLIERLSQYGLQLVNAFMDVGVEDAIAGETNYSLSVDEFYNVSKPVNDPNKPKGLRIHPFDENLKLIDSNADELPDYHEFGGFTKLYSNPDIRKAVNGLFEKYGFDSKKVEAFFDAHKNERRFSIYHDGYIILSDENEKMKYILKVPKQLCKDLT